MDEKQGYSPAYPPQEQSGYPPKPEYPPAPDQPGYTTAQPGYPTDQPAVQQPAYPAQQPAYPPAQPGSGYPPDQPGYPPTVQTGYPVQGYPVQPQGFGNKQAPPQYQSQPQQQPYLAQPQQAYPVQQQSSNVVVVQHQPTAAVHTTYARRTSGDHYLTLSIVLSFICFFCGTWWSLFCTIPAILFALNAKSAEERGDLASARSNAHLALGLDIAGVVFYVVPVVAFVALVIASAVA